MAGQGRANARRDRPHLHGRPPGDTLTRISQKFYGTPSRWPEILAANKQTAA